MNLDVSDWKYFTISDLFDVTSGNYYHKDEYKEGNTPYCSATSDNNGVVKKINLSPDFEGNKIIIGKIGCNAFYESEPFCATSDVNVLTPVFKMSPEIGLFLVTVINKNENFRWNYGRQCRIGNTQRISIKLPVRHDSNGKLLIDLDSKYSARGYVPDWEFMDNFVRSLHSKPIKTGINDSKLPDLSIKGWKSFYLHRIMNASMGNGIDYTSTTSDHPVYNYVSRNSNNNGVVSFVDAIDGVEPFPAGAMSLALGGSYLGSCFIQRSSFYTAQNVAVLQEKVPLSKFAKLFLATLIRNECKVKYYAFGRELNSHFRRDFILELPVLGDKNGIIFDEECKFSDDGYIPDWEFMDNYMKNLPYSDRI